MAPASGNTMKTLYHITSITLMHKAELSGEYTPSEYAREGFIHCSYLLKSYRSEIGDTVVTAI
jgi:uncharacterized protein (DUF952 family)